MNAIQRLLMRAYGKSYEEAEEEIREQMERIDRRATEVGESVRLDATKEAELLRAMRTDFGTPQPGTQPEKRP